MYYNINLDDIQHEMSISIQENVPYLGENIIPCIANNPKKMPKLYNMVKLI